MRKMIMLMAIVIWTYGCVSIDQAAQHARCNPFDEYQLARDLNQAIMDFYDNDSSQVPTGTKFFPTGTPQFR